MLTIDPTSICDVCGDQYGTVCLPYLIPCGHTFCRNCLVNINDNNPKGASCPLCRDTFTLEQIHLVRVDPADPLPKFSYEQINHSDDTDSDLSDNRARSTPWNQEPRIREEARQLELRVQQAASVKCTFEEVSALRDDIQNWLLTEPKYKPISKFLALRLSAALLRAILLNSLAFSEASKTSKIAEDGLRDKIKALESTQTTLQADIRRQQQQYSEKSHECTQLRQEVERLRRANPGSATGTSRLHSSPFPGPASPTSPTSSTASSNISSVSASSSVQSTPPPTRYLSSPETTSTSRLPPPRSVTTSPTRMNPYAPTSLSSIMSGGVTSASSRSSSAASSASSSPSTQPVREFFTPQSSRQTSPAPVPTSPPTPIPYATRPHHQHSQHHHQPKSGLESLMARTSAQPAVPRSMTAPLPPNGAVPPPIRNGTRPRPIQTSTANANANARNHAYPKVWLPMIDDTEDANSAAENTYTYSHMSRQATLRGPGTPTQTSIRR